MDVNNKINEVFNKILKNEEKLREFKGINSIRKLYEFCLSIESGYSFGEFINFFKSIYDEFNFKFEEMDGSDLDSISGGKNVGAMPKIVSGTLAALSMLPFASGLASAKNPQYNQCYHNNYIEEKSHPKCDHDKLQKKEENKERSLHVFDHGKFKEKSSDSPKPKTRFGKNLKHHGFHVHLHNDFNAKFKYKNRLLKIIAVINEEIEKIKSEMMIEHSSQENVEVRKKCIKSLEKIREDIKNKLEVSNNSKFHSKQKGYRRHNNGKPHVIDRSKLTKPAFGPQQAKILPFELNDSNQGKIEIRTLPASRDEFLHTNKVGVAPLPEKEMETKVLREILNSPFNDATKQIENINFVEVSVLLRNIYNYAHDYKLKEEVPGKPLDFGVLFPNIESKIKNIDCSNSSGDSVSSKYGANALLEKMKAFVKNNNGVDNYTKALFQTVKFS
ncbi:MAG: hypothetical protein CfP315_0788 [Candidatus Improbicoccus pseudotrichonymphae]|uniref:Uncharacterized protein n=1 Tax=Candidatus Improbicoccus pseudotrichonymphae TaxID=3033792 RepID=A0AA48KXA1_9FIRM|nr:MAG: hypothetical protein CfP315_0788 [Candidatus Improbicoccus pseudotrichonymphae]